MNLLPLDEIVFQAEPRLYKYRGKGYRSVTDYITDVLGDPFADVPQDRLEFCQGRGNAVHMGAALFVDGELDWSTVDPRIEGYLRAVERFHNDCPGRVVYRERRLVAPELGLAGTPDIVKFIRGQRAMIDYKTSQQMYPRMRLQTAGYKKIHNFLFPSEQVHIRYGLRLQPDSFYKLVEHADYEDEMAFDAFIAEAKSKEIAAGWKAKYA